MKHLASIATIILFAGLFVTESWKNNQLKAQLETGVIRTEEVYFIDSTGADCPEFKEYYESVEDLLIEIEQMNKEWGIDWGDTVCEGDVWARYIDAKNELRKNK